MTVTTVPVTCDIGLPDDAEFIAARLEITLSGPDYDAASNDSIAAKTVSVVLDGDGEAVANLWPVDRGTRNRHYAVKVLGAYFSDGLARSAEFDLGNIRPQSYTTPTLADLLAQSSGGVVVGSTIYATIADAVAAAEGFADDAAASAVLAGGDAFEAAQVAVATAMTYTETDLEMETVTVSPDADVIKRIPAGESVGQVAPQGQLTFWVRTADTGVNPYFTSAGPETWVQTGVRTQDYVSMLSSVIGAIAADPATAGIGVYASRAEMEAADISGVVLRTGYIHNGRAYIFIRDAAGTALTSNDGATWSPDGRTYPDHFAENTIPGTTNMAAAAQAAVDYEGLKNISPSSDFDPAATVYFQPTKYFFGSVVKWPASYQNVQLIGDGAIIVSAHSGAIFRAGDDQIFDSADATGSALHRGMVIKNFIFRSLAPTLSGTKALEIGMCTRGLIEGCSFVNFDTHIDAAAANTLTISGNRFYSSQRTAVTTNAFIHYRGVYSSTDASTQGAGNRLINNEFQGVSSDRDKVLAAIRINALDTLYFGGNHISFVKTHMLIEPLGSANNYANNNITDILSTGGNYFDDAGTGPQLSITGTICYDNVPGNTARSYGKLNHIRLHNNDKIRGAFTALNGVRVAVTDGSSVSGAFSANRGYIALRTAGLFSEQVSTAISILGPFTGRVPVNHTMCGVTSDAALSVTGGQPSILLQQGGIVNISDLTVRKELNAPTHLISLNMAKSGSDLFADPKFSVNISGIDASNSTYTDASPISMANYEGASISISSEMDKNDVGYRKNIYTGTASVDGAVGVVARYIDIPTGNSAMSMEFTGVIDTNTAATIQNEYAVVSERVFVRRVGAAAVVPSGTSITEVNKLTSAGWASTALPCTLVRCASDAWVALTPYALRNVVVNAGGAYVCVKGGTSGSTAPTSTSTALVDDGTVRWAYIGPVNPNRFAMVFCGQTDFSLRASGTVRIVGV